MGVHFLRWNAVCCEPSAISLEMPMEGHLCGIDADGTSGLGCKAVMPEGRPPPTPNVAQCNVLEGGSCWRTSTTTEDCQWSTESCIKGQG